MGTSPHGRGRLSGDERGVVLVLYAIAMVAVLTCVALAVDIGAADAQRRRNQSAADLVALAIARQLPDSPTSACAEGWTYVQSNISDLPAGATSPCTAHDAQPAFPTTCDMTTPSIDYVAAGTAPYTVTFRYPVPAGDSLLGAARTEDGTNGCARIGVTVRRANPSLFGGIAGVAALFPTARVVARHDAGTDLGKVANLVVLDPTGCTSLNVGGNTTKVLVGTTTKSGSIAVDSDGSTCSGGQATISASGTGAELWAQPATGSTPGQIDLYALCPSHSDCPTNPPCFLPACSTSDVSGGRVAPAPTWLRDRVTRAPVDHVYNCKLSYQDPITGLFPVPGVAIAGCTKGVPPYIDNLVGLVTPYLSGAPLGWSVISGNRGNLSCRPSGTVTLPAGNYWVNCPTSGYNVGSGTAVTFTGGNVIFVGNVSVTSGTSPASLQINTSSNPNTLPGSCQTTVCLGSSSANAAFAYLLNGNLTVAGGSSLGLSHTVVYVTAGSQNYVQFNSSATETWSAPTEGPFTNLALWSESQTSHFGVAGGGTASVDGVFFTPGAAPFSITGGFTNPQTAQFLSFQLAVSGGSTLTFNPDESRLIKTAPTGGILIR